MRRHALAGPLALVAVACGGSPAPANTAAIAEPRSTRVLIEDEEHEDGVELVSTRGRMDPAVVQKGLEPHAEALSDCYMSRVGSRRWLGGSVSLHWEISKTGAITEVKLVESTLGAWPVEQCLVDIAKTATFGKPTGGAADFSVPLEFSAKGRPRTWDDDQALRAVGGQLAVLDACKHPDTVDAAGQVERPPALPKKPKQSRKPNPKPPGPKAPVPDDVVVTLYVGPQGKAQSVGFASAASTIDPAWASCAERVALGWRLPDPRGQVAKLAIRYRGR